MVWLKAIYQPTTLFSLRLSWTTSTGGKTLLLPSPYAIKMAILDIALRTSGHQLGEAAWPWIRDLSIGVQLPPRRSFGRRAVMATTASHSRSTRAWLQTFSSESVRPS